MNSKLMLYTAKKHLSRGVLLFFSTVLLLSCSHPEPQHFQGLVMGTSWSAVITDPIDQPETVQASIQEALDHVDQLMSNWKDESDVCRFNRQPADTPLEVSPETLFVFERAMEVFKTTDGRFDPTLEPLIELWGFAREEKKSFPSDEDIQKALSELGMNRIGHDQKTMWKEEAGISLNLSAIAKGYGVDEAYRTLEAMGFKDFLVEVGGEIRVKGRKSKESPFRVGIETPDYNEGMDRNIFAIAELENMAMATSGDYRNYFEYEGKNYSHIIDPRTGYPVESPIASATVIATNCTIADAYATAFMILPPETSLAICDKDPNMSCMIIERETAKVFKSKGMQDYLVKE